MLVELPTMANKKEAFKSEEKQKNETKNAKNNENELKSKTSVFVERSSEIERLVKIDSASTFGLIFVKETQIHHTYIQRKYPSHIHLQFDKKHRNCAQL